MTRLEALARERGFMTRVSLGRAAGLNGQRISAFYMHRATPPEDSIELARLAHVLGFHAAPARLLEEVPDVD